MARALVRRIPNAKVFDPEWVGFMLQRGVRPSTPGDFQDQPLWRSITVATVLGLVAQADVTLVVPMTVVDPSYLDQTVGSLRQAGCRVSHVTLMANANTLRRRLLLRPSWPNSTRWALAQVDRCTRALPAPAFARHLPTDGVPVSALVEQIVGVL